MPVFDRFKRWVGPAVVSEPGEPREPPDNPPEPVEGNPDTGNPVIRVLVVDDSATIRALLGSILTGDGHAVLDAADGETAITTARQQLPSLIFLDIVLPGMSGFAVLRTLRRDSRTRATPIVMMSGNPEATAQFYVERLGADGFIKKPFVAETVFQSMHSLVETGRITA